MITALKPADLWTHFAHLNAIPRPSKQEQAVVRWLVEFAREHGLEVDTDPTGNVLIRKPASPGREEHPVVALQGHLDMVHQKNASSDFDFAAEGIRMRLEGDWVRAEGTTLGADNGIGVAAILAVLAARELVHPPLEALFTVDEETGLTGAAGIRPGWLKAGYLLNLDTEDDRELTIGCAGGLDLVGTGNYSSVSVPRGHQGFEVVLSGLSGGHSGMEIHLGLGNANKLMNRLLYSACRRCQARLGSIDGGGLRNAIPRESRAVVAVPDGPSFQALVEEHARLFAEEYRVTDPGLRLEARPATVEQVLEPAFQDRLLRVVYAIPNGIHRMSPSVAGLVQTSNNLARVLVARGEYSLQALCRSSVDSEKSDLADGIQAIMELLGARVEQAGGYPGWTPRPEAHLVRLMSDLYRELFGEEPHVKACHAGLECGILGHHYPDMEMISFGPTILGAHSPDERVNVASVEKFWRLLTRALERF